MSIHIWLVRKQIISSRLLLSSRQRQITELFNESNVRRVFFMNKLKKLLDVLLQSEQTFLLKLNCTFLMPQLVKPANLLFAYLLKDLIDCH